VLQSFVGGQAARQTRLLVFIVLLARPRLARHVLVVMVMRMMVVMRVVIAVMMVIIMMMVVVMVVMDGDDDGDVVDRSIDRRRGESLCGSHANCIRNRAPNNMAKPEETSASAPQTAHTQTPAEPGKNQLVVNVVEL